MKPPDSLRKKTFSERRKLLSDAAGSPDLLESPTAFQYYSTLSDVLIENSVGIAGIPMGIATGFIIDGQPVAIPMATEEPSVIAAASFGASLISRRGGITTQSTGTIMAVHIYIEPGDEGLVAQIKKYCLQIPKLLSPHLKKMAQRGGGYREHDVIRLPEGIIRVELKIDVCNAMGANILNTCGETAARFLQEKTACSVIMSILSNNSTNRRASASFCIPISALAPAGKSRLRSEALAKKIVLASDIARQDPDRAVTHNKGICNGITALALATANDTRAIEAAIHAYAGSSGMYKGLSTYQITADSMLRGMFEAPLPFAVYGGSIGCTPASRFSLKMLNLPSARRLGRIAAALGLAQNFAALAALTSGGIQRGHMKFHAKRLAFFAGAPVDILDSAAKAIHEAGAYSRPQAKKVVDSLLKGSHRQ